MKLINFEKVKEWFKKTKMTEAPKNSVFQSVWRMIVFFLVIVLLFFIFFEVTMVILKASKETTTVPYVISMDFDEAYELLQSSNLGCRLELREYPDINAGRVVNQEPEAGTTIKVGREVILTVSKDRRTRRMVEQDGEQIPARSSYIIRYEVPRDIDEDTVVKIVVYDWEDRRRVIFNEPKFPGESITTNYIGRGPIKVEVYLDGELDPDSRRVLE